VSGVVDAPHHVTISGEEGVMEFGQPFIFPSGVGVAGKGVDVPMQWWKDESTVRGIAGLAYQVTALRDMWRGAFSSHRSRATRTVSRAFAWPLRLRESLEPIRTSGGP